MGKSFIFVVMANVLLRPAFSFVNEPVSSIAEVSKRLTIEIGQYHLAYLFSGLEDHHVIQFDLFSTKDKVVISTFKELLHTHLDQHHFDDVVVVHYTSEITLMPSAHFHEKDAAGILRILFGDAHKCRPTHFTQKDLDITTVFGMDEVLFTEALQHFPQARHVHVHQIILNHVAGLIGRGEMAFFKAYFYPSSFTLLLVNSGKLLLLQQYFYESSSDVTFYILNAFKQMNIDPSTSSMCISGSITEEAETFKELNKLFFVVSFDLSDPPLQFKEPAEAIPSHYFTPSFLALTCV
jgi:hypothetical protein